MNLYEATKKALAENKCISKNGSKAKIFFNTKSEWCGLECEGIIAAGWRLTTKDLISEEWQVVDQIDDFSCLQKGIVFLDDLQKGDSTYE